VSYIVRKAYVLDAPQNEATRRRLSATISV